MMGQLYATTVYFIIYDYVISGVNKSLFIQIHSGITNRTQNIYSTIDLYTKLHGIIYGPLPSPVEARLGPHHPFVH